jgi:hypothetical protein
MPVPGAHPKGGLPGCSPPPFQSRKDTFKKHRFENKKDFDNIKMHGTATKKKRKESTLECL